MDKLSKLEEKLLRKEKERFKEELEGKIKNLNSYIRNELKGKYDAQKVVKNEVGKVIHNDYYTLKLSDPKLEDVLLEKIVDKYLEVVSGFMDEELEKEFPIPPLYIRMNGKLVPKDEIPSDTVSAEWTE